MHINYSEFLRQMLCNMISVWFWFTRFITGEKKNIFYICRKTHNWIELLAKLSRVRINNIKAFINTLISIAGGLVHNYLLVVSGPFFNKTFPHLFIIKMHTKFWIVYFLTCGFRYFYIILYILIVWWIFFLSPMFVLIISTGCFSDKKSVKTMLKLKLKSSSLKISRSTFFCLIIQKPLLQSNGWSKTSISHASLISRSNHVSKYPV